MKTFLWIAVLALAVLNLPYGCEPADPTGQDETPKTRRVYQLTSDEGKPPIYLHDFGECVELGATRVGDIMYRSFECENGLVMIPVGDEVPKEGEPLRDPVHKIEI